MEHHSQSPGEEKRSWSKETRSPRLQRPEQHSRLLQVFTPELISKVASHLSPAERGLFARTSACVYSILVTDHAEARPNNIRQMVLGLGGRRAHQEYLEYVARDWPDIFACDLCSGVHAVDTDDLPGKTDVRQYSRHHKHAVMNANWCLEGITLKLPMVSHWQVRLALKHARFARLGSGYVGPDQDQDEAETEPSPFLGLNDKQTEFMVSLVEPYVRTIQTGPWNLAHIKCVPKIMVDSVACPASGGPAGPARAAPKLRYVLGVTTKIPIDEINFHVSLRFCPHQYVGRQTLGRNRPIPTTLTSVPLALSSVLAAARSKGECPRPVFGSCPGCHLDFAVELLCGQRLQFQIWYDLGMENTLASDPAWRAFMERDPATAVGMIGGVWQDPNWELVSEHVPGTIRDLYCTGEEFRPTQWVRDSVQMTLRR